MGLDRKNRETISRCLSRWFSPPITASAILNGDWRDDITDREIEEDAQEDRHNAKRKGE